MWTSKDYRITWIGRDLRRSIVQPSAQSRVTCELRPGCSMICSVDSWQGPRLSLYNLSKQPVPAPDCPHEKKMDFISSQNLSCFSLCSLSFIFLLRTALMNLAPSFWYLPHRYRQDGVSCPQSQLSSRLKKPPFLSFSSQDKCSSHWLSWCLLLNSHLFIRVLVLGSPTLDALSRCGLASAE